MSDFVAHILQLVRGMTLGELIEFLEKCDQSKVLPIGFGNPHSYRGDYFELAFEPKENVLLSDMLADAKGALNKSFQGYKGGDYEMGKHTPVHIAEWGHSYDSSQISKLVLKYMLGEIK